MCSTYLFQSPTALCCLECLTTATTCKILSFVFQLGFFGTGNPFTKSHNDQVFHSSSTDSDTGIIRIEIQGREFMSYASVAHSPYHTNITYLNSANYINIIVVITDLDPYKKYVIKTVKTWRFIALFIIPPNPPHTTIKYI